MFFSPLMNTSASTLKPNIVTTPLEANATIEVANTYFSARKKERKKSLTIESM